MSADLDTTVQQAGSLRTEQAASHPGQTVPAVPGIPAGATGPGATRLDAERSAAQRWSSLARFGVWPLLLFLDLVAVAVGVLGTEWVGRELAAESPARKTAFFGLLLVVALWQAGLYRSRLALSVLDDMPVLLGRWLAAAGVAVLAQVLWSNALWRNYVINWRFLTGAVAIGVLLVVLRAIGYRTVRRLRERRLVEHRALIVGAGRVGHQVADILMEHPEYGLHPIGFLDADPRLTDRAESLPVLGAPADLTGLLVGRDVHNVVVAFSSMKESEMVHLIRTCDRFRCELFVVPRLFELHQVDQTMDTAWGLPLVRLRRSTYRSSAWRMKRLFDLVFAGGAVLLLAPVLGLIALAVRLDGGGGGILFRQERVGVDGRTFEVFKFRSMAASREESAVRWNIANDPRVTKVGRFLRKTSLDELPQLFNILKGDMSVVGPRPERPHFVSEFRTAYPSYEARHRVPSGLTGWAQVHGLRGDTSIADRARFDNYYIENWSLWLDLKIIIRTFGSVLRGAGG